MCTAVRQTGGRPDLMRCGRHYRDDDDDDDDDNDDDDDDGGGDDDDDDDDAAPVSSVCTPSLWPRPLVHVTCGRGAARLDQRPAARLGDERTAVSAHPPPRPEGGAEAMWLMPGELWYPDTG